MIAVFVSIAAPFAAVGIVLSIGLLIAPGAIAFLLTKQFERMLLLSVAVTLFASFTGIYISFFIDSAPAPTIILVLTGIFILAFVRSTLLTSRQ